MYRKHIVYDAAFTLADAKDSKILCIFEVEASATFFVAL